MKNGHNVGKLSKKRLIFTGVASYAFFCLLFALIKARLIIVHMFENFEMNFKHCDCWVLQLQKCIEIATYVRIKVGSI